jgi:hypothetical protein
MDSPIQTKLNIVCGLACIAVVLMFITYMLRKNSEDYALTYPFSPINASQVIPWNAQSVYSISGDKFNLCDTNDDTAQCAWKSLAVVDSQQNFADNINVQFEANSGVNSNSIGAGYLLSFSEMDPEIWSTL